VLSCFSLSCISCGWAPIPTFFIYRVFLVFSLFKLMKPVIRLKAFRPLELVLMLEAFMLIDC
jgi:hypothetical protein